MLIIKIIKIKLYKATTNKQCHFTESRYNRAQDLHTYVRTYIQQKSLLIVDTKR